MKTGDLIRALAADSEVHPMPPGRALALALIPGVAIALSLHFAILGIRPHLLTLLVEPRLLFKLCLTFLLVALSGPLVLRLVRPGAGVRRLTLLLAIVPALLVAAILAEFLAVPAAEWGQRLVGTNAMFCLKTIPFLSSGAARCSFACLASRRAGASRPCRSGGWPLRRGDRRGILRHALPGQFAAFRGGLVYVGDRHRRRHRRRGGVSLPALVKGVFASIHEARRGAA